MPHSLLLITGIFPPDSGGPAKFANEFSGWAVKRNCQTRVQTYADTAFQISSDADVSITSVSRKNHLLVRYPKMIFAIGRNVEPNTKVLAVGAFLETYLSSIFFRFPYAAKVPGDVVWERARNSGKTQLGIEEFQVENIGIRYKIFRKLFTASLKKSKIVIVPSTGLFNLCLLWGVPSSKLRLVYNSVEIQITSQSRENPHKYDLITVCRLAPWKGVDELIHYAANRNVSLVVVGDGPERSNLEKLADQLEAKVTFLGDVPHEQVQEFLSRSKVFVLNSTYEGLPHALVEARFAGILSVGRAGTGSDEVITDDTDGLLIRSDRPLEETLDLALSDEFDAAHSIKLAKIDSERRFNKEKNFPLILDLIRGISK
jgi:glycosyltransferase involved in cell wall biosynthesis